MTTNRVAGAAQRAIPGDQLYPLKISIEKVNLAMAFSEARRSQLNINFAGRRLEEIQRLVAENRFEHLGSTIDKFQAQAEQASLPLETLQNTDALQAKALASELKDVIDQKAEVLPELAQDVPQEAQEEIARLIVLTEDVRDEAERIENKPLARATPVAGLPPRAEAPVPPRPTDTKAATLTPAPSATLAPTTTPSPGDILIIPTKTATTTVSPSPTESPEVDETRIATTTLTPKPALAVSFTARSQYVTEGVRTIPITVQLEDSLGNPVKAKQDVRVPITISGNATIGLDFTMPTSSLVIPTGSSSADIVLNLLDEALLSQMRLSSSLWVNQAMPYWARRPHIVTITHGPTVFFTRFTEVHENARSVDIKSSSCRNRLLT
jgi:hypothetical protein